MSFVKKLVNYIGVALCLAVFMGGSVMAAGVQLDAGLDDEFQFQMDPGLRDPLADEDDPTMGAPITGDNSGTLLPGTEATVDECLQYMLWVGMNPVTARQIIADRSVFSLKVGNFTAPQVEYSDLLACAIKTGDIKLWMVPFFIRFILEFVIGLAGLLAVGFIVYGGFLYLFAGLSENKDAGKVAIRNGLIGMVISLLAWGIVSVVVQLVSSF
ncbi:hypothetical protein CVV38_03085 [Candidatus Peregrinibacteria bacterium HGW-Peregrinibacteria-1]|jgi:hypothetical protein|nr:MAG: hypothetical protein CVV38_03085 [Candidatus Peregrinibacteria bacterium HGW-Peregrinibacteria-1]